MTSLLQVHNALLSILCMKNGTLFIRKYEILEACALKENSTQATCVLSARVVKTHRREYSISGWTWFTKAILTSGVSILREFPKRTTPTNADIYAILTRDWATPDVTKLFSQCLSASAENVALMPNSRIYFPEFLSPQPGSIFQI